jgi:hypothetical protein
MDASIVPNEFLNLFRAIYEDRANGSISFQLITDDVIRLFGL